MQHFFSVLALWPSGSGPGQCSAMAVDSQSPLPIATIQGPGWGLHNTCPETQILLPAALVLFGVSAGIGLSGWLVLTPCWSPLLCRRPHRIYRLVHSCPLLTAWWGLQVEAVSPWVPDLGYHPKLPVMSKGSQSSPALMGSPHFPAGRFEFLA